MGQVRWKVCENEGFRVRGVIRDEICEILMSVVLSVKKRMIDGKIENKKI